MIHLMGEHAKQLASPGGPARLTAQWQYFRVTLELFVAAGIDLLDAMQGEPDDETDGTESEDDEGQYWIPGRPLLPGSLEDDEAG